MYYPRLIDKYLEQWRLDEDHKPLLLRGARQVGKSTAVRQLASKFKNFVEVNFEKNPEFRTIFDVNLDVDRIIKEIGALADAEIVAGKTLLFLDEIQMCPKAIMSLRFFKEDMRQLHVVAAGSLLEFALEELPTFGVGRIHSMYMYPMTFDEFVMAQGNIQLLKLRDTASSSNPLPTAVHDRLVKLFKTYILVGGMPEVVDRWVRTGDYVQCQQLQDDILISYEDDFPKYRKKVAPELLRETLLNTAVQATKKFVCSKVGDYRAQEVKNALKLLSMAGLIESVTRTDANGIPLGSEADSSYKKYFPLDPGLMLRMLNMSSGSVQELVSHILTGDVVEIVNKGPMAEMIAGLEMVRYKTPNLRHNLFCWVRMERNSVAEVDYVEARQGKILPIEVKAGTQGGMKSLWSFMEQKGLTDGIRCSLENFGEIIRTNPANAGNEYHIKIFPVYALSNLYHDSPF
ncbi:MAG: AAA family ATPase [Bacteroides sp.]|nr:AAA family ATPase [Bacteroides sp.]MCM1379142.1 AAA family ATPase [Bacteroides sp.]MCM1445336.1 AAA family ATPase [Prevotella sp.]